MSDLFPAWEPFERTLSSLSAGGASANLQAGLSYLAVRLAASGRSVLVLTDESRGELLAEDARIFFSQTERPSEGSVGFFSADTPLRDRSALLEQAVEGKRLVWFSSRAVIAAGGPSRAEFSDSRLVVKVGKALSHGSLVEKLSRQGYQRVGLVEDPGQFAVRGEVFDFWSPNYPEAVRIVYDNDIVETMHFFEAGSQRTSAFVPVVTLIPISHRQPGGQESRAGSLLEFLPPDAVVLVDRLRLSPEEPLPDFGGRPVLELAPGGADLGLVPSSKIHLQWSLFLKELQANAARGFANFVFCQNMGEAQRLEDILDQLRCPEDHRPRMKVGGLSEGFVSPALKIAVWGFGELVGVRPFARRLPKFKMGRALDSMSEIRPGDYIVHERFGIGRYRGLERISLRAGGRSQLTRRDKVTEFLALEYKSGDRLLVPIQDFRLVQKFVGQEGKKPALSSLDGAAWERVKQKVRQEIADLAADLLETAALRASTARPAEIDLTAAAMKERLQNEFSEAFPYEETPDQIRAIEEVLGDMDSPLLMDRLVCGDVGYGKTEIAMRAAYKAVSDGSQVLVLVPTTILAEQHFKTFTERFAAFPVRISMLSRFQKKEDQKGILADLRSGAVDIVIGTHRLLQKDVHPRDLGLIIIDEEHRFGVKQKEAVKKLKLSADVLALSATPIPRTLSQAMGGIRNISVIETPPEGRQPIETHLGLFEEDVVRRAIRKELDRGGQVFYVHNRISSIEKCRKMLEKILPGIRVGTAHGQMTADALEQAMWNFLHRKWDVLLATTIIESGLDIPSVNTLIVEDSEEFGLSQLYQLRGRVGRKKEQAYCYLFFSDWTGLSEDARKRLDAIQEFSALGSGMKLALRDLEIRGTGNLLGPQQHGWINTVGLELYCQMLSDEVQRLKQEKGLVLVQPEKKQPDLPWPEIELDVSAYIPEEYVDAPGERIAFYKRLIGCRSAEDMAQLKSELADRFGPLPEVVENLFVLIELKLEAVRTGVVSVEESPKGIVLGWPASGEGLPIDLPRFAADHSRLIEVLPTELQRGSAGSKSFSEDRPPEKEESKTPIVSLLFKVPEGRPRDVFAETRNFLQISRGYVIIKNQ